MSKPANHGKVWTQQDKQFFIQSIQQNLTLTEIATKCQRLESACKSKLKEFIIESYNSGTIKDINDFYFTLGPNYRDKIDYILQYLHKQILLYKTKSIEDISKITNISIPNIKFIVNFNLLLFINIKTLHKDSLRRCIITSQDTKCQICNSFFGYLWECIEGMVNSMCEFEGMLNIPCKFKICLSCIYKYLQPSYQSTLSFNDLLDIVREQLGIKFEIKDDEPYIETKGKNLNEPFKQVENKVKQCSYIFKKGKDEGKICKTGTFENTLFCKKHLPKGEIIPEISEYLVVYVINNREGTARIRFQPSLDSAIVGTLQFGSIIKAIESKNGWIKHQQGYTKIIYEDIIMLYQLPKQYDSSYIEKVKQSFLNGKQNTNIENLFSNLSLNENHFEFKQTVVINKDLISILSPELLEFKKQVDKLKLLPKCMGKKENPPKALRTKVWTTYMSEESRKGKCFCCRQQEITVDSTFECGHVISYADNGPCSLENLRPVCSGCNKSMGTTNMFEFIVKCGMWNKP
jgi:hypothetical protein